LLLGAEPVEALHARAAVRAVDPFNRGAPLELRGFGRLLERLLRAEERFDVNTVVYGFVVLYCRHGLLLCWGAKSIAARLVRSPRRPLPPDRAAWHSFRPAITKSETLRWPGAAAHGQSPPVV